MTYDDILDWTDDYMPDELFDNFGDWNDAIKANFDASNHHFPSGMEEQLKAYWEEKYGEVEEYDRNTGGYDYIPEPPRREKQRQAPQKAEIYYTKEKIEYIKQVSPKAFEIKYVKEPTKAEKFANARKLRRGHK